MELAALLPYLRIIDFFLTVLSDHNYLSPHYVLGMHLLLADPMR